ncbi:MAG: CPBP family intramembrane glutamic endopeptidase [Prolixibacteraceae bacterium]
MKSFYGITLDSFIDFIKKPKEENNFNASLGTKLKSLLILFSLELCVLSLFLVIFNLLKSIGLMEIGSNKITDLLFDLTPIQLFVAVVIAAPVLEEFIFRLPLRFKYNYLFRLIIWMISLTRLVPKERFDGLIQHFRPIVFRYFFYLMTISFGLVHITNFEGYKDLLGWMPFLTINQLFVGFILGFIRIKFGLVWSIIYHALNNLIFIGIAFLSINSISDYYFKDDSYSVSIKVVPKPKYSQDNTFQIVPGNIEFKNYRLSEALKVLEGKPEKYILISNYRGLYVDIYFNSTATKHLTDSARKIVIDHIEKALSLKIKRQFKMKEVLEPYVSDTLTKKGTMADSTNTKMNMSLRQLSRSLDYKYNTIFIASNDSNRLYQFEINRKLTFPEMEENLLNNYGLKFRKIQKELEFIKVE